MKAPVLTIALLTVTSAVHAQTIGTPQQVGTGIISTGDTYTHSLQIVNKGREAYFTRSVPGRGSFIFRSELRNGVWQPPVALALNGVFGGDYATVQPDGKRIWFSSRRPVNGDTAIAAIRATNADIFYAERKGNDWGAPVRLPAPVNTDGMEGYPAPARSALFFHGRVVGAAQANVDVFRAARRGDTYQQPVRMPFSFDGLEGEPAVDPQERWLFYMSMRPGGKGNCDIYVVFPTRTGWSEPQGLEAVNTDACEWTPKLSPDGATLFFARLPRENERVSNVYSIRLNTRELAARAVQFLRD